MPSPTLSSHAVQFPVSSYESRYEYESSHEYSYSPDSSSPHLEESTLRTPSLAPSLHAVQFPKPSNSSYYGYESSRGRSYSPGSSPPHLEELRLRTPSPTPAPRAVVRSPTSLYPSHYAHESSYEHSYRHGRMESSETREDYYYDDEESHSYGASRTIHVSSAAQRDRTSYEHSYHHTRTKSSVAQGAHYADEEHYSNAAPQTIHVSPPFQRDRASHGHSDRRIYTKFHEDQQDHYAEEASYSRSASQTIHVPSTVQCEQAHPQQYISISVEVKTGKLNDSHGCRVDSTEPTIPRSLTPMPVVQHQRSSKSEDLNCTGRTSRKKALCVSKHHLTDSYEGNATNLHFLRSVSIIWGTSASCKAASTILRM